MHAPYSSLVHSCIPANFTTCHNERSSHVTHKFMSHVMHALMLHATYARITTKKYDIIFMSM